MHRSVVRCLLLATACLAVAYSDHLLIVVTEGSCIAHYSRVYAVCYIHGE